MPLIYFEKIDYQQGFIDYGTMVMQSLYGMIEPQIFIIQYSYRTFYMLSN